MEQKDFHNLVEIQGIQDQINQLKKQISEEEKRIDFMLMQKNSNQREIEQSEAEISELKQKLTSEEKEMNLVEDRLIKAKNRVSTLTTENQMASTQKEIEQLATRCETLEGSVLEKMEELERLQSEVRQKEEFIKGCEYSLVDLKDEVAKQITVHKKSIQLAKERISSLLEDTVINLRNLFIKVNQRLEFQKPLTSVQDGSCVRCGMAVSRQEADEADRMNMLIQCPSCGRIVLPKF